MASTAKLVNFRAPVIEPELKQFIDDCLVPILVRDALKDLAAKDTEPLALVRPSVAHSAPSAFCGAEEMA